MDSKHRHELEKNELAKWIAAQYEDWIRPNGSWLGYVVLAGLLVVVTIMATSRISTWNRAMAWKQYYTALHSEHASAALEVIADTTSGIVGLQARLALAQLQLSEGCTQVFIDKVQAVALLEKAIASFQQVQKRTNDPSLLRQTGLGLGQCREALAAARIGEEGAKQNDLTLAEEEYQRVIERWGDSFAGQSAKKQLALIRQPSTKGFLKFTAARMIDEGDFGLDIDMDEQFMPGQQFDFSSLEETQTAEPETVPDESVQEPEL